jgi:hypothetical protein
MASAQSQHRIGIALVVAAAVAWSTAPFFTRLLPPASSDGRLPHLTANGA